MWVGDGVVVAVGGAVGGAAVADGGGVGVVGVYDGTAVSFLCRSGVAAFKLVGVAGLTAVLGPQAATITPITMAAARHKGSG